MAGVAVALISTMAPVAPFSPSATAAPAGVDRMLAAGTSQDTPEQRAQKKAAQKKPVQLGYPGTVAKRKKQRQAVRALENCQEKVAAQTTKQAKRKVRAYCATLTRPYVWTPADSSKFNYPFATQRERQRIRWQILNAIDNSPPGSQIRLVSFSFVDKYMTSALIRAYKRDVSVQILLDKKMIGISPPYHDLKKVIGTRIPSATLRPERLKGLTKKQQNRLKRKQAVWAKKALRNGSWVHVCKKSCRGTRGEVHSKFYQFSQVGKARWVTMIGSPNLTSMAVKGQWNHLDTIVGKATYQKFNRMFTSMRADIPRKNPYTVFTTKKVKAWVFPRPQNTLKTDPTARMLRNISCQAPAGSGTPVSAAMLAKYRKQAARNAERNRKQTARQMARLGKQMAEAQKWLAGADDKATRAKARKRINDLSADMRAAAKPKPTLPKWKQVTRRTKVRVVMYAWFDKRGNYLAKQVRRLWNQGCDVAVVYSISNGTVARTLTSKAGRGRIPTKKLIKVGPYGTPLTYNHSKYVAIDGRFAGKLGRYVFSGSMNFTHRGVNNDDMIVRLQGQRTVNAYFANFKRVYYNSRSVRVG